MSNSFEQQTLRRRRLTGALIGALLFHAALGLMPLPRFSGSWGVRGGSGGGAARGLQESFLAGALRGMEVAILAPPPVAPTATKSAPEPVPQPVPQEPESDAAVQEAAVPPTVPPTSQSPANDASTADPSTVGAATGVPGTPHSGDAPGSATQGRGDPGGGLLPTGPIEMELGSPRLYVHPVIPEKVLRKRKIKDDVILHLLVGTDGLVRDVKVLRAIPNCEECTQNAIDAARRQHYDAVILNGRPVEVWTTLSFNFNYGQ